MLLRNTTERDEEGDWKSEIEGERRPVGDMKQRMKSLNND